MQPRKTCETVMEICIFQQYMLIHLCKLITVDFCSQSLDGPFWEFPESFSFLLTLPPLFTYLLSPLSSVCHLDSVCERF